MLQEIVDDLLFGLLIKSSDIEGDEFELTPVRSHFREITLDMLSVLVGDRIFPVLSVVVSTPTCVIVFLLCLLVVGFFTQIDRLVGSTPSDILILSGLLSLLSPPFRAEPFLSSVHRQNAQNREIF